MTTELLVSLEMTARDTSMVSNQQWGTTPIVAGGAVTGRLHRAWSWVCFYSVKVQVTCNQGFQFMTHLRVSETLCNKL